MDTVSNDAIVSKLVARGASKKLARNLVAMWVRSYHDQTEHLS